MKSDVILPLHSPPLPSSPPPAPSLCPSFSLSLEEKEKKKRNRLSTSLSFRKLTLLMEGREGREMDCDRKEDEKKKEKEESARCDGFGVDKKEKGGEDGRREEGRDGEGVERRRKAMRRSRSEVNGVGKRVFPSSPSQREILPQPTPPTPKKKRDGIFFRK
jgi:hypothetical protein